MVGIILRILINAGAFYGIAKLLPGFRVKNEGTALGIAVGYSILGLLSALLIVPLAIPVGIFLALLAFIPLIGPLLASAGLLATKLLLAFVIPMILLIAIDKFMEDFEMDSLGTAALASLILGGIHMILGALLGA